MVLDVGRPPLPPRPHSAGSYRHELYQRPPTEPPPVPPLPPNFRFHQDDMYRPKSADPYFAPQPQRPMQFFHPNVPQALDERFHFAYNHAAHFAPIPPQPPVSYPPRQKAQGQVTSHVPNNLPSDAFSYPGPSPALSPPPHLPAGAIRNREFAADVGSVTTMMGASSLNDPSPSRVRSMHGVLEYPRPPPVPPVPSTSDIPQLAAPLPSLATLQNALASVQSPSANVSNQVAWIRDVLLLVNRTCAAEENFAESSGMPLASNSLPSGPIKISDISLKHLGECAVALLISIMPTLPHRDEKLTPPLAEALYIRATLTATGAFPELIAASPRNAFREFEASARAGFARGWFRLGRDYEGFDDVAHARQCFERGMSAGDPGCIYRIGMAMLLGQLDFPANTTEGVRRAAQLLHQAATLATIDFPHPPYVFALFLLGEFEKVSIPSDVLLAFIPAGSNSLQEARRHLLRSAFLHFAPAQQRLGRAYEFAEPPFPFDPNLSLEYYSLASAGGDAQADLALSKWYLCGAEGFFGKDEGLARDYAARAASRELPAAMFAMGYYCEVGIGGPGDVDRAQEWYEKAAASGDVEAEGRLKALRESSVPLSREQHITLAETRLVRTRTQARIRSDAISARNAAPSQQGPMQQQRGHVYQRRQASLPSHVQPADQYTSHAQVPPHHLMPQHSFSLPPQRSDTAFGGADYVASPAAFQQPAQRQFVERPRYSLVDPGIAYLGAENAAPSFTAARRSASAGTPLPPMRRHHNGQSVFTDSPRGSPRGSPRTDASALPTETGPTSNSQTKGATRYNTFAEMGIEGGRAEDKECRIM